MSDKPKTQNQKRQPEMEERGPLVPEDPLPALAGQRQTNYASQVKKYGRQILWLIKAPWRLLEWLFKFCDDNEGGVTAIATIAIAVLTAFYVIYSRGQLRVIDGQLKEMQSTNRPYVFPVPRIGPNTPTPQNLSDIDNVFASVSFFNVGASPGIKASMSDVLIGLDTDESVIKHHSDCKVVYPAGEGTGILPPSQGQALNNGGNGTGLLAFTANRVLAEDARSNVFVKKTSHVVIFGGIKYSGLRGGDYETIYDLIWDPDSLKTKASPYHIGPCSTVK